MLRNSLPPQAYQSLRLEQIEKARLKSKPSLLPLWERKPLFKWQVPAAQDKGFIVLLTGGAGGGKSYLGAEMAHDSLMRYPGSMWLMLRKAREFATKSIVPMMQRKIIKDDARFLDSKSQFVYPNGSVLAWGGMKDDSQREALRSIGHDGALDGVLIEEANAFTETDFEELIARMRGKAGPYRQIILMTNPGPPSHWINQRLILGGEASVYYSYARDNPANPPDYLDKLDQLTGIQRLRLRDGKWVQAEGIVYDNWDTDNVTDAAEYDPGRAVIWGVDDGYVMGKGPGTESYHPRVILFAQMTAQGFLHVFDELYVTQEPSERTLDAALARPYSRPDISYIDSSAAELKGRFFERGLMAMGATHSVYEGIKNLRRMVCDGAGVRQVRVHPRCKNLIQEMQSYRYDENSRASTGGEPKPLKVDDHGADALRYIGWQYRYGAF